MADTSTLPAAPPRRMRLNPIWLAVPGVVFLILFMLLPVGQILMLSVTDLAGAEALSQPLAFTKR